MFAPPFQRAARCADLASCPHACRGDYVGSTGASEGSTRYFYDSKGRYQRLVTVDANGKVVEEDRVTYEDDTLTTFIMAGQVSKMRYRDQRLIGETNDAGTSTDYDYDDAGRLVRQTVTHNGVLSGTTDYTYDDAGRLAKQADRYQVQSFYYDDHGRLARVEGRETNGDGIRTYRFNYDDHGRLASIEYGPDRNDAYRYDDRGRLVEIIYTENGATSHSTFSYECAPARKR
jgi:YD repeat-containing protein